MEEIIGNIFLGLGTGVSANMFFELLKGSIGDNKANEIVKYKANEDFEKFKEEILTAIEYNPNLKEKLEDFANQRNTNIKSGKNTYYSERDMYIHEKEEKDDPKH